MSDHEDEALDALRSLDGPAELGDGVEARIEADMLARFDERVGAGPVDGMPPSTVVDLDDAAERARRQRSNRRGMTLGAAAAVALVIAGVAVFLARDDTAPANPPETSPPTTPVSTDPASDEAVITEQLATFCAEHVAPVRTADALWRPSGRGSESRQNVLVEVEAAAQAMSELDPPLGDRLAETAEQLLGDAANARLETTLNSAAADDAVSGVRDLLYAAPSATGVSPLPDSCLP